MNSKYYARCDFGQKWVVVVIFASDVFDGLWFTPCFISFLLPLFCMFYHQIRHNLYPATVGIDRQASEAHINLYNTKSTRRACASSSNICALHSIVGIIYSQQLLNVYEVRMKWLDVVNVYVVNDVVVWPMIGYARGGSIVYSSR